MTLTTRTNGEIITASYFNDIKTEIESVEADLAATTGTTSDDFAIGDGTDTTKSITANNADFNKPQMRYNHTLNVWEFSNDGVEYTEIGSGSGAGSLATYKTLVADNDNYTDFDVTNLTNATFGEETTAPLDGEASYLLTNVTGSVGEFIYSPDVDIPLRAYKDGVTNAITFPFSYDGDDSDLNIQVYDITNSALLEDALNIESSGNGNIALTAYIPGTCEQIKFKVTIAVENNGKKFIFDNITFTDDPFVYKNLIETQEYNINQDGSSLTNRVNEIEYNLGTAAITNSGAAIIVAEDDSSNTRTKWIAQKKCTVNGSAYIPIDTANRSIVVTKNGTAIYAGAVVTNANEPGAIAFNLELEAEEYFTIALGSVLDITVGVAVRNAAVDAIVNFTATAETEYVVHASAGTENTFTAKINTGTTGTWSNENADFISSIVRSSANVTITLVSDFFDGTQGVQLQYADVGLGLARIASVTSTQIVFDQKDNSGSDIASTQNWYLTINRGDDYKNPNAYAVTPLTRTVYLKDIKSSGTGGGTFTSGSYQTRDLNTVEGDSEIVSLSSNQFTLSEGTYEVDASAPAYQAGLHKANIHNVTDSSQDIIGTSEYSGGGGAYAQTRSFMVGMLVIGSTPKTFEVRHRGFSTVSGNGFGRSSAFGDNERYTQIKITKVK